MGFKRENILLIFLPVIIVGLIIYNAHITSKNYMIEHGLDKGRQIYIAKIIPNLYDVSAARGKSITVNMELINNGNFIWSLGGEHPVHLSYHILNNQKKDIKFDNERYNLPHDLRPGKEVKIDAQLKAPLEPGEYILEFDMVEEGITWFRDKGSLTSLVKLHVN